MKKFSRAVGIMLAALMLLALTAALATAPCPDHKIGVEPATQTVAPGNTFAVTLMQDSPAGTSAAEVGESSTLTTPWWR